MAKIFFVGAGPGDPELITLKGRRLLDHAGMVIYAGSLVNPALLEGIAAKVYDSSGMDLDQIVNLMQKGVSGGLDVVRLHTGDLSFYSAISEQIAKLRQMGLQYEIVPGVSSAGAGAAALEQELTIPDISQTVIHTRIAGRTPVPEAESLESLAAHQATMVIFLSVGMIDQVAEKLLSGGYAPHTPVKVVEKASWPQQRVISGTVCDIAEKVTAAGIKKTALIFVGRTLEAGQQDSGTVSKLYDKTFQHGFRQ